MLLSRCELFLGRIGLHFCIIRLLPRVFRLLPGCVGLRLGHIRFLSTRIQQYGLALVLRGGDLCLRLRLLHPGLAGLRAATGQVRIVVHDRQRQMLLQGRIPRLQIAARVVQVGGGRLLRQRLL